MVKEVKEYLDIREINGYSIHYTPFHPEDPKLHDIQCLVYIGLPDNPQFLGAQPPQAVAEKIYSSRGPSGENRDYLFQLEQSLEALGLASHDEHISDLSRRVNALLVARSEPVAGRLTVEPSTGSKLSELDGTDEQEEVEENEVQI